MAEYDVAYRVTLDDKQVKEQLAELEATFQSAFNEGLNFGGTKKEVKELIAAETIALKEMQREAARIKTDIANAPTNSSKRILQKELDELNKDIDVSAGHLEGLRQRLRDMNAEGTALNGLVTGARGVMGAFTAASGAVAMFGGENEDLVKVQTRLQASMSILMGMQQVQNALVSTSTFRIQILNRIQDAWRAMNLKVAASEGVKKAAMAGVAGLIALAVIGIAKLISAWSKHNEEVKQAKELLKTFKEEYASSLSSQIGTLKKLEAGWKATNGDLEKQRQFFYKNKDAIQQLDGSVRGLKDAEDLFNRGTDALVSNLKTRAKAAAKYAQAMALIKKAAEIEANEEAGGKINGADYGISWRKRAALWLGSVNAWGSFEGLKTYQELLKEEIQDKGLENLTKKKFEVDAQALMDAAAEMMEGLDAATNPDNKDYYDALRKRVKQAQESAKQMLRTQQDLQRAVNQAELEAMRDGQFKTLQQMKNGHKDKMLELEREKEDYIKKMEENAKAQWLADPLNDEKDWGKWKPNAEQQKEIDALFNKRSKAEQERYNRELQEFRDKYLEQYADFVYKFKKIGDDYEKARLEMLLLGLTKEEQAMVIAQMKKQNGEMLAALGKSYAESWEDFDFSKWYAQMRDESLMGLEVELAVVEGQFEAMKDTMTEGSAAYMEYVMKIEILREALKKLGIQQDVNVEKTNMTFIDWTNRIEATRKAFAKLGDTIQGTFGEVFATMGNAIASIQQMRNDLEIVNNAEKKFSEPQVKNAKWSMGVSVLESGIQLIGMFTDSLKKAREEEEKWALRQIEVANKLAALRIEALAYRQSNIFGVENPYAKALAGAKQYSQAMTELQGITAKLNKEGQVQVDTKRKSTWSNVLKGIGIGAAGGAIAGGGLLSGITAGVGAIIGGAVGLGVGLFSKRVEPVMAKLTDKYGQLYDAEYNLNQELLADYDNLDDPTKKQVDALKELVQKAKEAKEQIREVLTDLVGDLGNKLSDALISGFESGGVKAAMQNFKASIDEIIWELAQQNLYSHFFETIFNDFQKDLEASMDVGGDGGIADDLLRFYDGLEEPMAAYLEELERVQQALKEQGILTKNAERTAAAKAISGVSQDSFNVMMGILTNMQSHTFNIAEAVDVLGWQNALLLSNSADILDTLRNIHIDTSDIKTLVGTMEQSVAGMNTSLGRITDKGVRMLN